MSSPKIARQIQYTKLRKKPVQSRVIWETIYPQINIPMKYKTNTRKARSPSDEVKVISRGSGKRAQ